MKILSVVVETVAVVLLADFVSGFVHWAEDTFWTEETPVLGRWIVKPNVLHHCDGSAFIKNTWLQSSWDLLLVGILIIGTAAILNLLSWQVWLFVVLSANANQVHKWSHSSRSSVPVWVQVLQRSHLLQGPKHHAAHHRCGKNTAYCILTEALNPLLDGIGFWRALDRLVVFACTTPRRTDIQAKASM